MIRVEKRKGNKFILLKSVLSINNKFQSLSLHLKIVNNGKEKLVLIEKEKSYNVEIEDCYHSKIYLSPDPLIFQWTLIFDSFSYFASKKISFNESSELKKMKTLQKDLVPKKDQKNLLECLGRNNDNFYFLNLIRKNLDNNRKVQLINLDLQPLLVIVNSLPCPITIKLYTEKDRKQIIECANILRGDSQEISRINVEQHNLIGDFVLPSGKSNVAPVYLNGNFFYNPFFKNCHLFFFFFRNKKRKKNSS